MTFCPRCGVQTEHQFCIDCLRRLHPMVEKVKHMSITMCPLCTKIQNAGGWKKKDVQEAVEKVLERSIVFRQGSRVDRALLEPVTAEPGKQDLQLSIVGSAEENGPQYEEFYQVSIYIEGNRCPECEQAANTYFTGILQLRRPNEQVQHEIERLLGKALTDVKDVTGGIDYYVTDHRILQNVARQVHKDFGGELTVRAQHFSYDNLRSKNLYRVNACVRLPKFWKGSLVYTGTKLFVITNMGKALKGIDIETGKTLAIPCKNDYEDIPTMHTTVVTTRPTVTVLDPETFQTVPIANPTVLSNINTGDTIRIATVHDKIYIVPYEGQD